MKQSFFYFAVPPVPGLKLVRPPYQSIGGAVFRPTVKSQHFLNYLVSIFLKFISCQPCILSNIIVLISFSSSFIVAVNFGPENPRQISDFVVSAAPMHSEELLICMSFFIWSKDPPHLHFNNLKVSHNYFINCGYFRPLNLCAISFLEFFNLLEARVLSFISSHLSFFAILSQGLSTLFLYFLAQHFY